MQSEIAISPAGRRYDRVAVVRAIPHPPHKRRWCGLERWVPDPEKRPQQEMEELPTGGFKPKFDDDGRPIYAKHALPWPETEVKVGVVDEPELFDPNANGGVPVEISPATFAMLQKDHRISAYLLDGSGGDPAEVVRAKAEAAQLDEKLASANRHIASLQEQVGAAQDQAAAKVAGEIAKLRQQLAEANRKLAEHKK